MARINENTIHSHLIVRQLFSIHGPSFEVVMIIYNVAETEVIVEEMGVHEMLLFGDHY